MTNPFDVLGLARDASPAEVVQAWRRLAKLHHPDAGGCAVAFNRVHKAYKQALELACKPVPCQVCGGTGKVATRRGFESLSTRCTECKGAGKQVK